MSDYQGVLGVIKIEEGYQFSVWAPHAKSVVVKGSFNQWQDNGHNMNAIDNGIWFVNVPEAKNGDEYKFQIETASGDKLDKNDPRARRMTNSMGNSVIYDDDYRWEVTQFTLAPIHQRVIYELHIGTFNRTSEEHGTFNTAIAKLSELVDLGINTIELMPVNEFAGDISWGYNPAYPYSVEEAYGGPDELKRFIDEAHKLGIGVILDVVYNHFGPSDLDIWQFDGWCENDKGGIYFYNDHRSSTPWGETRPDYGRLEVQDYIRDNAIMWLKEFNADGLRMDMVPFMRSISGADNGSDDIPEAYKLIQDVNTIISHDFSEKMSIAEDLHRHHFITNKVEDGGCGYTAQWDAEFVHPIRKALTESNDEHVNLDAIVSALQHVYSGNIYSRIVYTESHDEVANGQSRVVEEVAPGNVDDDYFAEQKGVLAAALVFTSAGVPMLFQGQELKETGWFDDNTKLDWSRKEKFPEYFEAFKTLISLRKNDQGKTAGLTGSETEVIHRDDSNKVIGYRRSNGHDNEQVFVYLNFSNTTIENYQLSNLPENMQCAFAWADGIKTSSFENYHEKITMPSYGVLIFSNK